MLRFWGGLTSFKADRLPILPTKFVSTIIVVVEDEKRLEDRFQSRKAGATSMCSEVGSGFPTRQIRLSLGAMAWGCHVLITAVSHGC